MKKDPLQELLDLLSKSLYNLTVNEATALGICIKCKQPALKNCYSAAGRKEFYISGLCEKCYDKMFKE